MLKNKYIPIINGIRTYILEQFKSAQDVVIQSDIYAEEFILKLPLYLIYIFLIPQVYKVWTSDIDQTSTGRVNPIGPDHLHSTNN